LTMGGQGKKRGIGKVPGKRIKLEIKSTKTAARGPGANRSQGLGAISER